METSGILMGKVAASAGESPLFMGQKLRRRSSDVKPFIGDSLHIQENQSFVKAMSKTGDKSVLFSDEILKVNRKYHHL